MDNSEIFDLFGIWVIKDFLRHEGAEEFVQITRQGTMEKSRVSNKDDKYDAILDEQKRKSHTVMVPRETEICVRTALFEMKPAMEEKFGLKLDYVEGPQFLYYLAGDYFKQHRDRPTRREHLPEQRLVTATIFCNDGAHDVDTDSYQGGQLVVYGHCRDGSQRSFEVPIRGLTGAMIAFRSDLLHEVKPVISGERITIVAWYH